MNFCAAILIVKMEENVQYLQHSIFYISKKGKIATEGAVTDGTCQKWFVKFLGTIDILAK